jgi:putative ubiquitin-RnfH superfamily antitoxin RatB of RatAB toxin-antitoxin module
MRISVAIALPSRQEVVELDLPAGSTVADALGAVKPEGPFESVGIWGARVLQDTVLREGDRVELYRALKADPKDQRRRRVKPRPSTRSRSGP